MTTFKTYISAPLHVLVRAIENNKTFILLGLASGALIVAAFFGYRSYTIRNERQAQNNLTECLHEYDSARVGDSSWEKVEELCREAYAKDHDAHTAPCLLALQADALVARGRHNEALVVMKQSVDHLTPHSSLYPLYMTKYALAQMDSADQEVRAAGLTLLETLAKTPSEANHDRAAYYLGLYHFVKDDITQARSVWDDLINAHKEFPMQSPWVQYAKAKLELL